MIDVDNDTTIQEDIIQNSDVIRQPEATVIYDCWGPQLSKYEQDIEDTKNNEIKEQYGISGSLNYDIKNSQLQYEIKTIEHNFQYIYNNTVNSELVVLDYSTIDIDNIINIIYNKIKKFFTFIIDTLKDLKDNLIQFTYKFMEFIKRVKLGVSYYRNKYYKTKVDIFIKDLKRTLDNSYIYEYINNDEFKNITIAYNDLSDMFISIISNFDELKSYINHSNDFYYLKTNYNISSMIKDRNLYEYLTDAKIYKDGISISNMINAISPEILDINELSKYTDYEDKTLFLFKVRDQLNLLSTLIGVMEQTSINNLECIDYREYAIFDCISNIKKSRNNKQKSDSKYIENINEKVVTPINNILGCIKKLIVLITSFIRSYTVCLDMTMSQFKVCVDDHYVLDFEYKYAQ